MKWIAIFGLGLSASAHAGFGDGLMRIPYSAVAASQESAAAAVLNYCLSTPFMKTGVVLFDGIDNMSIKPLNDEQGSYSAYGECIFKSTFSSN